jgi:hypothetical protein
MIDRSQQTWPTGTAQNVPVPTREDINEVLALVAAQQDAGEDEIEYERRTR